ncbi:glycerol-3-phosphate dehydrogenase/oxidase [Halobacteriovorax sp. JY17]|uniref:glycerol-3-phosphate dehydrogenase/oxidase n=1 Tax=Halobacteriovorax sp. JY17 TaxID=2014617 RepID=UPI0025BA1DF1|nr:glycerol-3-phosphate dehydrogenase/oxidase [Halobacteriovorax sp. JY17]
MDHRQQLIHSTSPLIELQQTHFNTLVIGGGIVGAGVLRDLSLHGVDTLLVEKRDFASQTSCSSSKMLHGGIRYLENLDFALVHEALAEKNLWLKLAPHLCREKSFYLPVFKDSLRPLWMIRLGIFLYDFLSNFQNSTRGFADEETTIKEIVHIKKEKLRGSGIYSDAIVDDGKLALEVIMDALENTNARALSYTSASKIIKDKKGLYHCELTDELTGDSLQITCENLVLATGPFTDKFVKENIAQIQWSDKLLPSKGSHIWIRRADFPLEHPVVLTPNDGRVIFVIPHHDRVLIGTTEEKADDDFFDITPSDAEIQYLLTNLREFFPTSRIDESHITAKFSGIRPLVKEDDAHNRGKTAREHKIYSPLSKLYIIVGGKYTTFRTMAQEIAREIVKNQNLSYNPNKTKSPLRKNCQYNFFHKPELTREIISKVIRNELPRTYQDLEERRIHSEDFHQKLEEYFTRHTI